MFDKNCKRQLKRLEKIQKKINMLEMTEAGLVAEPEGAGSVKVKLKKKKSEGGGFSLILEFSETFT